MEGITCYISGKTIEVNGQEFRLGELTEDVLNIPWDTFREMDAICDHLERLGYRDAFETRVEATQLRSLLLRYKIFRLLLLTPPQPNAYAWLESLPPWWDREENELFSYFSEEKAVAKEEPSPYDESEIQRMSVYCQKLVHDIYAVKRTLCHFIDSYIRGLEKMDAGHYAGALFTFLNGDPIAEDMLTTSTHAERVFRMQDEISVQYVPRQRLDNPDCYTIYECYHLDRMQGLIKLDFFRALMEGHVIRRCKNCEMYFLLTHGYKTEYCDRPLKNNPKRTCRNQGAKNFAKEKAANNPVLRSYGRAYQRVDADCRRGRITDAERLRARTLLVDLRDEAISGKYRDSEVEELMRPDKLYGALGIVRRGGR